MRLRGALLAALALAALAAGLVALAAASAPTAATAATAARLHGSALRSHRALLGKEVSTAPERACCCRKGHGSASTHLPRAPSTASAASHTRRKTGWKR